MNRVTAGLVAVAIAHIIWGFTTVALKLAVEEIPPFTAIFFRFLIASAVIIPFFLSRPYKKILKEDFVPLTLIILVGISLHMAFFVLGLREATVVTASLIFTTSTVIEVMAAWIFLKEKISFVHKIGIVLGFLGVFLLILRPVFTGTDFFSFDILANSLLFGSVLAGAVFVVGAKNFFKTYAPTTLATYTFVITTVSLAPFSLAEFVHDSSWVVSASLNAFVAIIFSGLFASLLAYLLIEWGLSRAPVNMLAPLNYLTPLISIIIGIFILKEPIDIFFFVSGVVVIFGVFLATFQKPHHHIKHQKS